jgi:hypothetical protein
VIRRHPAGSLLPVTAEEALEPLGLHRLGPAELRQVDGAAALQTRVDRKYLLPVEYAGRFVEVLAPTHHVLSIDGRRATTYATVYYDSPDWVSYRAHAQGRRRRWKARTRLYSEDLICRLELKTKGVATTVKNALDLPASQFGRLDAMGRAFLAGAGADAGVQVPVERLAPGVRIDYVRATLADLASGTRVTVDGALVGSLDGRVVRLREDLVVVETKGGRRPALADRVLLEHAVHPTSLSKYGAVVTALEPGLPGHPWRRVVRDFFRCV